MPHWSLFRAAEYYRAMLTGPQVLMPMLPWLQKVEHVSSMVASVTGQPDDANLRKALWHLQ
eukprot:1845704-Alexandrium_andersonii.AAC.1